MTNPNLPASPESWRQLVRSRPRLRRLLSPRRNPFIPHRPTIKQAAFLLLECREALFGGAAGGGKSDALLMAALQYVDVPGYAALLLRRTYADLALPGALMARAHAWLAGTAARWSETEKTWSFPSGATLGFGYLDHPKQKYRYQSSEFQFIGFDELTQFDEAEYTYLFSRLRRGTALKVPLRMRAASNPGGAGHDWVRRRFLLGGQTRERFFVPATLADNPFLDRVEYAASLANLDPTTRAQLLMGDWDAEDDGIVALEAILGCQADCLWPEGRMPALGRSRRELYLGVDIGRTRDRTVVWTWERVADVFWCREIGVMSNATFREQKRAIVERLGRGVMKAAIDKGGIGWQLAEELEREYPDVVEGVVLTSGKQGRLARRLAIAFGERRVRIPDDQELARDLRQVRRPRTVGGVDRVETARGPSGHADRFWAAALGLDAAATHEPAKLVHASLPLTLRPSGALAGEPPQRAR